MVGVRRIFKNTIERCGGIVELLYLCQTLGHVEMSN